MANNVIAFSEMQEFIWGLQTDKDDQIKPVMNEFVHVVENVTNKEEEQKVVAAPIREAAIGKGLGAALKLLKERGALEETSVELCGRNTDKKKSKLVAREVNNGYEKEICIERRDDHGRILTPKEAFRQLSHKFHGKVPGTKKRVKRMRQYEDELKIKRRCI